MRAVVALAIKDLRVLSRVPAGVFFTFVWPFLVAVLFGILFSGPGRESAKIRIAVADEDAHPRTKDFISRIVNGGKFDILQTNRSQAAALVRQGNRTAAVVLPRGFGEAMDRMFYGAPPKVEVLIDPSRKAESAMLEGILFQQAAEEMQKRLSNLSESRDMIRKSMDDLNAATDIGPADRATIKRFLENLDQFLGSGARQTPAGGMGNWKPLEIENTAIALEWKGPRNAFDVTFPQGILWGIIGCVMTFGIGIVSERTHGTLHRLQIAPLTNAQLLAGKALACFLSITAVQAGLFIIGRILFKVHPSSVPLLAIACLSVSVAFVGIMMLTSTLGKTEQAAAGAGWAVMLPMSLLGGGMLPLFLMPSWMRVASQISPVRWSILALEGAIWRDFTLREMALPCCILAAIGIVCFLVGTRSFRATY